VFNPGSVSKITILSCTSYSYTTRTEPEHQY